MVVENKNIFTCGEIEAKSLKSCGKKSPNTSPIIPNLKLFDPAVMRFSSQNELTRYGKAELMALKETSSAKSPPMCQLDQRIARLNILNEKKDEIYEKQQQHEQHFRNLMPNFTNNWDRNNNFLALLNNYHGSLPASLPCPQGSSNSRTNFNPNCNKVFSNYKTYSENLVPAYDRKNFFDNITTTTTMRPQARMGIGSFEYQKNRQQYPKASPKERQTYYNNNTSTGVLSTDDSKSSYNESMNKLSESKRKNEAEEEEPEWFSCPASRQDFVELHGFEDDEAVHPNTPISTDGSRPSSRGSVPDMMSEDFLHRNHRPQNDLKGRPTYRRPNQPILHARNMNNHNNSFCYTNYENSVFSKSSSFNSSNRSDNSSFNYEPIGNQRATAGVSPFFDLWKLKHAQQENINFLNCINSSGSGTMMTIADVENGIRQNAPRYGNVFVQHPQSTNGFNLPFGNHNMPQFFQNALDPSRLTGNYPNPFITGSQSTPPSRIPTREQLQQHTSEIMRNAMMRKQFRNDRKYPK